MLKKFRFYAILLLLLNSVALMVLFIITCVKKKKFCWGFLVTSTVQALSGAFLLAQLGHEEHSAKKAEAYLAAEFDELEHGSLPRSSKKQDEEAADEQLD